jgi:hypothetical protein
MRTNKDEISKRNFEPQLSRVSVPLSSKWLVFMDALMSPEEFFGKNYIPLDSFFLVTQSSSGSRARVLEASLSEVYHVRPSLPLQVFRIGNWSSVTGLSWSSVPFLQRRGNLRGTVIKAALRTQVILPSLTELRTSRCLRKSANKLLSQTYSIMS